MREVARKHRKWKRKALARYTTACETYIHARREREFEMVIQAWDKPGISWPMPIRSFDELVDLAGPENTRRGEFTTLVEEES
jgi:hypothetical protein